MSIDKRIAELSLIGIIRNYENESMFGKIKSRYSDYSGVDEKTANTLIDAYYIIKSNNGITENQLSIQCPDLAEVTDLKFFISCIAVPVEDEIGHAYTLRARNFEIPIKYYEYRDNIKMLKELFFPDNRIFRWGTSIIKIELVDGLFKAYFRIKDRNVLIPTNVDELFVRFCQLTNGILINKASTQSKDKNCLYSIFKDKNAKENVHVIFSIYASHVKSNPLNLPIICMKDDREYEVCDPHLNKSHVLTFKEVIDDF